MEEKFIKSIKSNSSETNDCTVRSFSEALDIPYDKAHSYIRIYGDRKPRKGINMKGFLDKYPIYKNKKIESVFDCLKEPNQDKNGNYIKLSARALTLSFVLNDSLWSEEGNYILLKRGHASCMKNGIIYDSWKMGDKTKILQIYKITDINE